MSKKEMEIVAMLLAPGFMIAGGVGDDAACSWEESFVVHNPMLYTEEKVENEVGGHQIHPKFTPLIKAFFVNEMLVRPMAVIGEMADISKKFFDSAYTKAMRDARSRHTGILQVGPGDMPGPRPVR